MLLPRQGGPGRLRAGRVASVAVAAPVTLLARALIGSFSFVRCDGMCRTPFLSCPGLSGGLVHAGVNFVRQDGEWVRVTWMCRRGLVSFDWTECVGRRLCHVDVSSRGVNSFNGGKP